MKFQIVHIVTRQSVFTGTGEECQEWLADYGLGVSQFEMLPYCALRDTMDISETY